MTYVTHWLWADNVYYSAIVRTSLFAYSCRAFLFITSSMIFVGQGRFLLSITAPLTEQILVSTVLLWPSAPSSLSCRWINNFVSLRTVLELPISKNRFWSTVLMYPCAPILNTSRVAADRSTILIPLWQLLVIVNCWTTGAGIKSMAFCSKYYARWKRC